MRTFILLLLFGNGLLAQNQISIEGKLIDNNGKGIPYASVINLTSDEHGTTSNEKGQFLLKTRTNNNDKIQISALGFYELRVTVGELVQLAKNGKVELKEKPFDLGEVQVDGERYEQDFIGKSTEIFTDPTHRNITYTISSRPGQSLGVYVKPGRKVDGLIDKIHFYLSEDGSLDQKFAVRFFRTKDKLKNNRVYKLDQFDDMTDSLLLFSDGKAGWNTLDLYNLDIYVDDRPFFIVFTSLESLEESKARDVSETTKSARLGTFANLIPDEIFTGLGIDGGLGFMDYARVRNPIPAVYVEYSKVKK